MRRLLSSLLALAFVAAPCAVFAQDDSDTSTIDTNKEFTNRQAPLPVLPNAGPCPTVKVLYDAARYIDFKGGQQVASQVAYSGEIEGLTSACAYKGLEPIRVSVNLLFQLGKGPQATGAAKTYSYWVAVTDRNRAVIGKQYFTLPVTFPNGSDRAQAREALKEIVIPRVTGDVSGNNFEILIGFDVTPEMAAFNRDGKRFQVEAGQAGATAGR
ncbi:MAG: hypothetical protein JWM33_1902 [Caulobacteraceae bacterium]|nr:hypothetical protein [Caulobacteraceae bacterium]